jgi:hypothetical protein
MDQTRIETGDSSWKSLYKVGATAALISVLIGLLDIFMSFLPSGLDASGTLTVIDWFRLFQDNWFLGLRNLGLFNVISTLLAVPTFLALYAVHRRVNPAYAALAVTLICIGAAVYTANNGSLSMLALSNQYAAATGEPEQTLLVAAGQAVLAEAEDFTPGTFVAFLIPSAAAITMAAVLLRGRIFNQWAAWAEILGGIFLLLFTISATFMPSTFNVVMILAMLGGLLSMAYNIMVARRLFQLAAEMPSE